MLVRANGISEFKECAAKTQGCTMTVQATPIQTLQGPNRDCIAGFIDNLGAIFHIAMDDMDKYDLDPEERIVLKLFDKGGFIHAEPLRTLEH